MNILFINPPWHRESGNIWKTISSCQPPFGLALLAALVREKGYSTSILDCNALRIGLDRLADYLPKEAPRFVGITATTVLIDNALGVAGIVRKLYPKTKIIIGGVHPTVMPKEVLSSPKVDYIVMSEGEETVLELLSGIEPQNIKGIGYKKEGRCILNQVREIIPNLDIFPFPAYDMLPMDKYHPAPGSYKRKPAFGMVTSRGCPGRCTFCKGDVLGRRIRFRSAEKMIEEIHFLKKHYKIKEVQFYDDTFTTNRANVKKFCNLILENHIDLTWCCFSRVDTVDKEMLSLMKKAGCHQVMFGVESADETILKNMNKRITLQQVEETVAACKEVGIDVRLAFMLGSPGETEKTMEKNIQYAIFLDPDLVNFNITTPYPGTEMFRWAQENNYLLHTNWQEYDLSKPVMNLPTVSTEGVLEYYKKSYRRFYLRPSYVLKRIRKIRSFRDLQNNFRSFVGLLRFYGS